MIRKAILAIDGMLLVCLGPSALTFAQLAGGTISGTVTDTSGGALPNAAITLLNQATGVTRNLLTNQSGFFSAPNLLPGPYQVTASVGGFATFVEKLELKVGAEAVVSIQLKLGELTERVVVDAGAPKIDQATSKLSATVEAKTIRELPLNGRDWTMLATLEPTIHTIDTQSASSLGNTGRVNRGWGTQLTVAGARPQQNNYRLDGISINDYSGGGPGNNPGANLGVEAIEEYSVVSANPSAEYGKTSGGVFNAITRSGTNEYHGSVYEFFRNSALDAANFIDNETLTPKPPFTRNQFGVSLGGPLVKDRTFIFGNYEALRENLSTTVLNSVPSRAARNGQLTAGTVAVDPRVAPFLNLFPLPNVSETGDVGIASLVQKNVTSENFFTVRLDHKFSEVDSAHATFMSDSGQTTGPDNFGLLQQANFSRRMLGTLEENHIFGPSLFNTARVGYSRVVALAPKTVSTLNPLLNDLSLGFLPGNPVGVIQIGGIARFQGVNAQSSDFYFNSYQAYDDLFYTVGNHALKFGASVERTQLNEFTSSSPNGGWTYGSLRNFLTDGTATSFIATVPGLVVNPTYLRQTVFGLYVQDDFRMRQNLTLNLGLRYEIATVPTEKYNRLATLANITDKQLHLGSPYFKNPTLKDLSPRVGFSWDPFKDGKTAVRSAFGVYDTLPLLYQFELSTLLTSPFFRIGVANGPSGLFPASAIQLLTPEKDRVSYIEQNPKRSYVLQWNFNIQREVLRDLVVQLGYLGTHGVHQPFKTQDADLVIPTETADGLFWPTPRGSGTRLNENFGQINGLAWEGFSLYEGLNLRVSRRREHSQAGLSYTWAKSIDNNSASVTGGQFNNSINGLPLVFSSFWRGPSDYDVRHSFVANYLWEIPGPTSGKGLVQSLANGWQLGGIFRAQSGLPFTVTIAGDSLGMSSNNPFNFPDRLNTSDCKDAVNPGSVTNYIKTQCFVVPSPTNRLGNAGRNTLRGPSLVNLDVSLYKNNRIRRISENFNIQLRAEAFNVLNHANFRPPTGAATQLYTVNFAPNPGAGILAATATTSRQVQLAVRVAW